MTLLDQFDLGHEATFQKRVQVAVLIAAIAVQEEDDSALSLPAGFANAGESDADAKKRLHDLRTTLAYRILHTPTAFGQLFAQAVATNPTIAAAGGSAPDNDIQFVVNSIWNAFAVGESRSQ